jgi:hypothetical protein
MIDDNPLMRAQLCRWMYAERALDGQVKRTKDHFLLKANLSFRWIKYLIEKHYGDFPTPRLPAISLEDRKQMFARLMEEGAARGTATRKEI